MKSRSLRALAVMLMLFSLGSLVACGKTTKTVKEGKATIETSDEGVKLKFKDDEGEVVIDTQGAKLPDSWPEDIPAFPKAKVISSATNEGGIAMKMAVFQTGKTTSEVTKYYEKQLPDNGWEMTNRVETGPTVLLMASKDKRAATVSATKDPASGETMISVSVANKPE